MIVGFTKIHCPQSGAHSPYIYISTPQTSCATFFPRRDPVEIFLKVTFNFLGRSSETLRIFALIAFAVVNKI